MKRILYKIKDFFEALFVRKSVLFSFIVIMLFVIVAVFCEYLAPYDPYAVSLAERVQNPSLRHLLGTDTLGRDVLSRLMYGARTSLAIAVVSILIGGASA